MSKKTIFVGVAVLLILCFSSVIHADQYYDQYSGDSFHPEFSSASYFKDTLDGYIYHTGTDDVRYTCPVNFNVPDGSAYFIKSIGIRFKDNLTDGLFVIQLRRKNLYTGAVHVVAQWQSEVSSPTTQTASQGTIAGYKLIDSKKFAYWLYVYFFKTGAGSPGADLTLHQVRVHYGT